MKPNAENHNPAPDYLRDLVERIGLSQRATAKEIGIDERTFRNYLSGKTTAPYPVQYTLESLAGINSMNTLTELHHFSKFSISRSFGGDYYAELDTGKTVLLLSPNGSDESNQAADWHESSDRIESDYDYDDLIRQADEEEAEEN